jgi:ribonuclease-3
MSLELERLEVIIGHSFTNRELLRAALTHASHAYEANSGPERDNQRLEFLGDAVLGLLASEHLVRQHPDWREGRLSILKNYLVSAPHLAQVAQKLNLGEHLLLGRGEEMSGGRAKAGVLADALEALIGALYLDGGLEAARRFAALHVFSEERPAGEEGGSPWSNYKGALQEAARDLDLPAPRYVVVAEEGPPHARRFTVEVRLGEHWTARGEGPSKKEAGQRAARALLLLLLEARP